MKDRKLNAARRPGSLARHLPPGVPAPKLGSDAPGILRGIGLGADLDRLVGDKVVALDGVSAG